MQNATFEPGLSYPAILVKPLYHFELKSKIATLFIIIYLACELSLGVRLNTLAAYSERVLSIYKSPLRILPVNSFQSTSATHRERQRP
jgi:hypothetical protein